MSRSIAYLAPWLWTAGLAAQAVTLPSYAATAPPSTKTFWLQSVFYGSNSPPPLPVPSDSHTQLIYATSDVALPAANWNGIAFRRPSTDRIGSVFSNANPAILANATIVLSTSSVRHTSPSARFASNHGPGQVTVFAGQLSLPARSAVVTWPAPWEPAIPFGVPFPFVQTSGRSLVVDILQRNPTGQAPWWVEASIGSEGKHGDNGGPPRSCTFGNGRHVGGISYRTPVPGGSWWVIYQSGEAIPLPSGLIGWGVLGVYGLGGTWNGMRLPIELAGLGAPGCTWNVSADYVVPLVPGSSPGTYQWPPLTIPNDPSLSSQWFREQPVFVDASANTLGLVTGWSSVWQVGVNANVLAAVVEITGPDAVTSATGTWRTDVGVSIRLN